MEDIQAADVLPSLSGGSIVSGMALPLAIRPKQRSNTLLLKWKPEKLALHACEQEIR